MKTYQLTPLDTLFFRDGRPFNLGETGQMEVEGIFPPSPTTVVGAMRAALAKANGWDGRNGWSDDIKAELGDGRNLGGMRFGGPHLLHNGESLFPTPLSLLGKQIESAENGMRWILTHLSPGNALDTDIGTVRLPQAAKVLDEAGEEVKGLKELNGYLTPEGMRRVLAGEELESSHVVARDRLWSTEPRIGIKRDPTSRTTKEDSLYQIQHVRLREGVSLAVTISGTNWQPQNPALLGGEGRMAWLEPTEGVTLPQAPDLQPDGDIIRYIVTLITPAAPPDESWRKAGIGLFGLPGKIVSACVGKPVMIGGWDSLSRKPLALEPHLPAGSIWFIEANASDKQLILDLHGKHIGEKAAWGYGQILIGTWREQ